LRDLVDELLQAKVKTKLFGGEHAPRLGRLQILDRIGAGAMGTVFAAYDPRLERKVAVKVLRPGTTQTVLAEARALAKLAHPNVVAVHDVDELDGMVYLVMELAPGVPLRSWAGGRRDWKEVVTVMRGAGKGIAAAHAAGLVHRDIKPDNILVGDDRARVVDFGLAHAGDDGNSAGTPSYMAPEVLAGEPVTAASDQFSFGVALYEALYGRRPHGGAEAAATTQQATPETAPTRIALRGLALTAAQAIPPSGHDVPAWVHAVVVRTLAADPRDRYPAMSEVVSALAKDRRRVQLAIAIAIAAVVGGGLGVLVMRGHAANPCNDATAHRASVWSASTRAGVRTGLGGAPWTAATIAGLDDASARWEASYKTVCEATRVHGGQSDALLELRMRCLDRVLDRFGALTSAIAGPGIDPAARAAAPSAVAELPRADACEALTDPNELALPTDPVERDRAIAADKELARGWASFTLGRYRDARTIASELETTLAKLDAPAIHAATLVLVAAVEARIGEPAVAQAKLAAALDASAKARSGALELEVWARLLRTELFAGSPAHVIEWAPFAHAAAARAGRKGAEIDGIVAEAMRDAGQLREARELLDRALAAQTDDQLRPDQIAVLELNLGSVQLAAGDSTAAATTLERARARVITAFGDRHPDLALYADKLAAAARARGRIRDALRLHDASAALRTAAFGDDDRAVATSLYHRAQTELEAGELDHAQRDLERALAIRTRVYGETSARLGEIDAALGDVADARGNADVATRLHDRAVALDPRIDQATRLGTVPELGANELLSVDRAAMLLARERRLYALLVPETEAAQQIGVALKARYRPGLDPRLTVTIANAWFATGQAGGVADLFAAALAESGNDATRTALDAAIGLAQCDDPRAPQAARTAIALYQAMPELGRGATYDLMHKLAKM
jgi:tetratricopeptide (TPR) repeat protein